METLLDLAIDMAESGKIAVPERRVRYNRDVEAAIARIREKIEQAGPPIYNSRWLAIKLLENDQIVRQRLVNAYEEQSLSILETVDACRTHLTDIFDDDPEIVMTDERYGFIAGLIKEVVHVSPMARADISRNIDLLLTNRYLGFPIFIFFIWLMFQATFSLGAYPMAWIESGFALLAAGVDG
ncbi:MAG: ferrous iron transporter B, partial [Thermodesulfobacteriota bacterium]|nr:ferrous iron transporter B [Thermodesulfobacteriota bacterium]